MGNCYSPCTSKLNDISEVQVNENPEKSNTVVKSAFKRKKTKFPKNIIIKDDDNVDGNDNKDEKVINK